MLNTPIVTAPSLKYWRYRRLYTRGELARVAGVDWHTIARLETSGTARSSEPIQRLARALDVRPTTLQRPLSQSQAQYVTRWAPAWAHDEHRG